MPEVDHLMSAIFVYEVVKTGHAFKLLCQQIISWTFPEDNSLLWAKSVKFSRKRTLNQHSQNVCSQID